MSIVTAKQKKYYLTEVKSSSADQIFGVSGASVDFRDVENEALLGDHRSDVWYFNNSNNVIYIVTMETLMYTFWQIVKKFYKYENMQLTFLVQIDHRKNNQAWRPNIIRRFKNRCMGSTNKWRINDYRELKKSLMNQNNVKKLKNESISN